jgi:hypothetical protein
MRSIQSRSASETGFGGGSNASVTGGMRGRILLRTYRLR